MKTLRHLLAILLALAYLASAAPVTLAWDASADAASYQLRYSRDLAAGWQTVPASGTEHTLDLPPGEYQFEVVAIAGGISSAPSNRVTHTLRPAAPSRFRIVIDATVTVYPVPAP